MGIDVFLFGQNMEFGSRWNRPFGRVISIFDSKIIRVSESAGFVWIDFKFPCRVGVKRRTSTYGKILYLWQSDEYWQCEEILFERLYFFNMYVLVERNSVSYAILDVQRGYCFTGHVDWTIIVGRHLTGKFYFTIRVVTNGDVARRRGVVSKLYVELKVN